jgi:AraC-like DNA-binding protein
MAVFLREFLHFEFACMIHLIHTPGYPLSQFVENFWFVKCPREECTREKILPDGAIELMINLGSPHKVFESENSTNFSLCKRAWLSGPKSKFIVIDETGGYNLIGIRFKKGGAYPFFDFPMKEVEASVIELDLIWGSFVNEIIEKMSGTEDPRVRFELLEHIILSRIRNIDDRTHAMIQYSLSLLENNPEEVRINELVNRIGISHKHFLRKYESMVGLGPKVILRINRFQKTICLLENSRKMPWAHLAYECNYYDQAHFIREFKSFSGMNPRTYFANRGEYVNYIPMAR